MKAMVVPRAGATDKLKVMDVPVPDIGADEVLVRVHAVGVGLHDRWYMPKQVRYPYPIGIEAAGVVERIGSAVSRLRAGQRVMFVSRMQPRGGTWAEYAAVRESEAVAIPDTLDFIRAAALPVAGTTALAALRSSEVQPGERLFVAGASGAIGTLLLQLAGAQQVRIAASASAANQDYLRRRGAELAVDYRQAEWGSQVRQWAPGGVDAAIVIPPGVAGACLEVIRERGRLVTVSGDEVEPQRQIQVQQVYLGEEIVPLLGELVDLAASGRLEVEIERVYPLERGVEALEKTETRHARGKVVLEVAGA